MFPKKTAKKVSPESAVVIQPKPQIPSMLAAIRRALAAYQANTEVLEARLACVMRPGEVRSDGAKPALTSAAPVAETLSEYAGVMAALNARVKDVLARLEI
jgi:hypothetical protein